MTMPSDFISQENSTEKQIGERVFWEKTLNARNKKGEEEFLTYCNEHDNFGSPDQKHHIDWSQKAVIGQRPRELKLSGDYSFGNFTRSALQNIDFRGAGLAYADFIGADLKNLDFRYADLKYAGFTGAVLEKIVFGKRNENIDFSDVQKAEKIDLSDHEMVPALPSDVASITGADFLRDAVEFAEWIAESKSITGLIPFKIVKSIALDEYADSVGFDEEGTELPASVNPFHISYSDIDNKEIFDLGGGIAKIHADGRECHLALCFKITGSNDEYGQFRGIFP